MAVRGSRLLEEENQRVSDTKYETKQWKCNGDGRELCEGDREERLGPVQAVLVFEFLIGWQHFSPLHRLLNEPKKLFSLLAALHKRGLYEIASVRQLKHLITVIFVSCVFKASRM